jgi:hypothetical protein
MIAISIPFTICPRFDHIAAGFKDLGNAFTNLPTVRMTAVTAIPYALHMAIFTEIFEDFFNGLLDHFLLESCGVRNGFHHCIYKFGHVHGIFLLSFISFPWNTYIIS